VVLIHCSDGLWYTARRAELETLFANAASPEPNQPLQPLEQSAKTLTQCLGPERTPVLFPDMPLASALPHLQRWPLLPVTNRAIRGSLEGAVSLQDVLNRYQQQRSHGH
jgi:CIC family chloride channel protein